MANIVLKILFIIIAVILAGCGGFYLWYAVLSGENGAIGELIVYIISAIILIVMGALGVVFGWMEKGGFIGFYFIAMTLMFVLSLIQFIIVAIALASCEDGDLQSDDNPFNSLCVLPEDERWKFWFPTITLLVVELAAAVSGFFYNKNLKDDDGDDKGKSNYY